MPNIQVYLRENLKDVSTNVFVAPKIPEKKLNNAIKAFRFSGDPASMGMSSIEWVCWLSGLSDTAERSGQAIKDGFAYHRSCVPAI